jgi:hypothetical protein
MSKGVKKWSTSERTHKRRVSQFSDALSRLLPSSGCSRFAISSQQAAPSWPLDWVESDPAPPACFHKFVTIAIGSTEARAPVAAAGLNPHAN